MENAQLFKRNKRSNQNRCFQPSAIMDVLAKQVEAVVVAELIKLGYRVRVTEITNSAKFNVSVDLCMRDEKLALVSIVNGKDVQRNLGFPDYTCLIMERDNYHFIPTWCKLDMIIALVKGIVNAPAVAVCCVCSSPTGLYCWKCNKGSCRNCISTMPLGLQVVYLCPSCGTKNALDDRTLDGRARKS
ncbi:hypothetical protein BGX30_010683 [Mortierella sp. GBA39]|nr:hypothetical protein BGX30_010683 [Mortierella sp. GBA39]